MREIKFRAWDTESKAWFPFDKRYDWFNVHQDGSIIHGHNDEPCFDETDCKLSLEVMQFTGLTDKNGKEIYEGDILRVSGDRSESTITQVYFSDGAFLVQDDFGEYEITAIGYALEEWSNGNDHAEIIGNIHENPELMEAHNA